MICKPDKMSENKMKTKSVQKILEPVQEQVKKLQQLLHQEKAKTLDLLSLKSVLFDQMQLFINKLDNADKETAEYYEEIKKETVKVMDNFCLTLFSNNLEQLDQNSYKSKLDALLENFTSSLKSLEDLECLPLKQALKECVDYVQEMGCLNEIEDFENIKDLGTFILDTFGPLQTYRKSLTSNLLSDRIALYSRQLYITFSMLVQLIHEQHDLKEPIYSTKKYFCDRMCHCLKMIIETLDRSNPSESEESFEQENHFVYRMDIVLDRLSEICKMSPKEQLPQMEDFWRCIEDVFCHAMAIAQVCELQNFNAITGTCQTIMAEFAKLKVQLQMEPLDIMLINLFFTTLNDALYQLEHKINVSMLSLVMETFAEPYSALRKLIKSCGYAINAKKRVASDLHEVIEEFDQATDRLLQIGLFAVACCKNRDRTNRIRSCLASFESMETELIPAVTAFYLHPDNKELRTSVKLLTEQWQKEVTVFQRTIYLIIDSAAYCQVVLDDLQDRITKMTENLDNFVKVTKTTVQVVVKKALSLTSQISMTIDDVGRENIDIATIKLNQELKAAIYEANAAANMLLHENAPEAQQLRVIKRCELILNVIKKLLPDLNTIMNASSLIKTSRRETNLSHLSNTSLHSNIYELPLDQKTVSYIRTPYTVRSCRRVLSIQPANSVAETQAAMSSLIPYIEKGKTMRTEHSIMYKTPLKCTQESNRNKKDLSIIRQHLFSRESFHEKSDISLNDETLNLTSILDKVTNLCDTMNKLHLTTTNSDTSTKTEDKVENRKSS